MTVTIKEPLDPHDVTDFRFQGLRKIRLSGNLSLTSPTMSLITTVPNTGMVLVVGDNCVHVVKTVDVEKQNECTKTERNIENCEINRVTINMPGEVLSVGVSCDGLTTSIVVKVGQFPTCLLYDTRGILTSPPDLPLSSTSLNTSSTMMTGLYWNPALADMFCVTWEDGSLALYTVKTDGATDCLTLPPAGVVDMAWSPKGKQLVVLKSNRDLVQYKPDLSVAKYPNLKEMKTIPGPAHDSLVPVSISWLSTYEFLVGLRDGGESEGRPGLWLVKGSKEGHVEHTPYDDICYSTGEMDKMMYTTHTLSEWGVVVVGSSTSIELGVLGDGYAQWLLEDNARAEIPLSSNEECYPVGMAVDYTSAVGTPVGETTGPPSPLLYLLSSDGLLCPFYCVNHKQGAAPACRDRIVLAEGKRTGTVSLPLPHKKTSSVPPPDKNTGAVLDTSTGSVQNLGKQSFGQPISSVTKPAANLSDIFALSGNSSFAQSTPMKPPPSSKPIAVTDPSPALPATSSFSAPKKEPTPPFRSMSKDPTPTLSKRSTPVSKEPSPTLDLIPAPKESTPITDTTSAKVSAAIDEEYAAFESELKELRGVLSGMKTFIGTQEDKVQLCTRTESCSKFCRDVIDTTKCQNTEIFSLRSSTLETFSWLEEAKARDSSTGDTRYLQLLRARPLDPRSLRKMEDLRAQFFYCEKQVEEAGNALDSQWEDHVGKLKRSIRSDQQSVREELSKAVMTNHKIIDRQRESVDEIKKKLLDLQDAYPITMGRPGRSPGKGKCETELDKLAESLREKSKLSPTKSVNNLRFSTPSPVKLSASAIVSPVKAFSPSIDQALRDKLDNRPLLITKAVNREKQLDRAEQPSSAKLLEKLKETSWPTTQTKIAPSGSLSGLPSDKSAFQAIPTSHNSNKSSFQPVSVSKQSTAFTSGSISVVVTASSTPVKAPVYEPISPASNSPEKTDEIKEPSKAPFGLPVMTFGSSLVKTAASIVPSSEKAVSIDAKVENMKPVESVSSKSLFASFGSGAALGNASSLVSSSSSTSSPSISTSVGSSKASSNTSSTDGIFSSSSSFSSFGSKLGNATEVSAAGDKKSVTSLVTSTTQSDFGFGSKTSLSFGGPTKSTASTLSSVASSVSAVTSSSAAGPVFGGLSKTVTGGGGLTFGASSGSIFGGSIQAVSTAVSVSGTLPGVTQSTPALIATPITSVISSSGSSNTSIFGGTGTKPPPPVTTTGEAKSTGSLFGGAGQSLSSAEKSSDSKSVLTTSSSASVLKATSQPTPSTGSVFGGTSQSLASTASVFGGASKPSILTGSSQPASSTGSVFGGTSQPTSSTGSVFGGASQTTTSTLSVFGATSSANTSTGSVFGGASKISTSTGSVFGESSKSSDSTGGSVFGGAPKPAASAGSVFGGTSKATVASGSVFGGTSQPAAVTGSVFGGTSTASVFGGSTNISAPAGPVFGGTSQSATTTGSVFGGTPQSTASSIGSVFGGATQAKVTTESVFGGQTKSAVSTGTVFGGGSQPSANAGSVFGGSSTLGTAGSAFGGSSQPSPSVFGGTGGSVFGGTPNTAISSNSAFGATTQTTTTASVFGGSTSSVFGGSSTGGSGGFMGGLGGTGSVDNSNKNPFGGTTSTFGSSSTAGLFGSSGTQSVFGGTSQPSAFGSASSFSGGGGGNISSQGFGVQNTPTKPSGFGAAPAFGSPPALGSAPAFGSPAGFGGTSTFGGGATFGSSGAASSAFGAATNAPTFGSMAASSAPAFGSMASSSPAFGSSGSAFGGGGGTTSPPPSGQQFSSWR